MHRLAAAGAIMTLIAPAVAQSPPEHDTDAALLPRVQAAFESIIDAVAPSVVAVYAQRRPTSAAADADARRWLSTGTGLVVRGDGTILTSQHVIAGADTIEVIAHDGRRMPARPVAEDTRADLAAIRVDSRALKPALLGDARNLRRGHLVMILGNPLGLAGDGQAAVSVGVISAMGRPLPETFGRSEDRYYGNMIQIAAPIHPGNSGGPLVDIRGQVVGIITAAGGMVQGASNIGFAVPLDGHTKPIIDRLLRGRTVEYGFLGVEVAETVVRASRPSGAGAPDKGGTGVSPVVKVHRDESGDKPTEGDRVVTLHRVFEEGPAHQAGMQPGDQITDVEGEPARSADRFIQLVGTAGPGASVTIGFKRNGRRYVATPRLARRPVPAGAPAAAPSVYAFRGATLQTLDPATRLEANLPDGALLVTLVKGDTPAHRAGLNPGDVVVRWQGRPMSPLHSDLPAHGGEDVLLGLASGGSVLVKSQ